MILTRYKYGGFVVGILDCFRRQVDELKNQSPLPDTEQLIFALNESQPNTVLGAHCQMSNRFGHLSGNLFELKGP